MKGLVQAFLELRRFLKIHFLLFIWTTVSIGFFMFATSNLEDGQIRRGLFKLLIGSGSLIILAIFVIYKAKKGFFEGD